MELGIRYAADVGLWRRARAEGLRSCRSYWVAIKQKPSMSWALMWSLLGFTFALCTCPGVWCPSDSAFILVRAWKFLCTELGLFGYVDVNTYYELLFIILLVVLLGR